MKTSKFYLLAIAFLIGLSFTACKKSSDSTDNSLTGTEVTISQDAESQDAQADNVDQSTDNIIDALESNNYSATKSAMIGGPFITVVRNSSVAGDTSVNAFPITVTLDFSNSTDSTINSEKFKQSGKIIIIVDRTKTVGSWKNCLKRTITFNNYTVSNDSASFSVTGYRIVTRKEISVYPVIKTIEDYKAATSLRVSVLDSIKSSLTFTVTCGTYIKNFTRVVSRTRRALAHFEKAATAISFWHQVFLKDTLIYKGSVTGVNLMDSVYSRIIADNDPIVFTRCALLVPVISSGTLNVINGTKTATITYSKDACKTLVTITNSKGKTKEIERKLNRLYKKWW